ncbi:hypothetical protein ABT186_33235 [Streptomyces sp. NPDC001634]|uniref:hypothetical protein n=1 Tax=Streptomyces sp. NPDC001634 TaxID=3154390 RepID=UPI003327958C
MGIRPLSRRTAIRVAVLCAALPPPVPAHARGASTARLPAPSLSARISLVTVRAARGIRAVGVPRFVSQSVPRFVPRFLPRLRAFPSATVLRRGSRAADARGGHRQDDPVGVRATAWLQTALTGAQELLRRLAASHRPRFLTRDAEAVSGAPDGSVPYERVPGRQRPDATP